MDRNKSKYVTEKVMKVLMLMAVFLVFSFLASIIWTIFVKGIGSIAWEMVSKVPGKDWNVSNDGGFLNAIVGSLAVVLPSAILAACVSIPVVFYMNLYLRRGHKLSYAARLAYDILYGIPSIVYGAFAFTVMVIVGVRPWGNRSHDPSHDPDDDSFRR